GWNLLPGKMAQLAFDVIVIEDQPYSQCVLKRCIERLRKLKQERCVLFFHSVAINGDIYCEVRYSRSKSDCAVSRGIVRVCKCGVVRRRIIDTHRRCRRGRQCDDKTRVCS